MKPNKKTIGLGVFFAACLLLFFGSIFGVGGAYRLITGFLLFISLLLRSLTGGPSYIWTHYKKQLILSVGLLCIIVGFTQNWYRSLSFLIIIAGIAYTFWDTIYHQHHLISFRAWNYCMYGAFHMVYFIGFAVGAQIIGSNNNLVLDCQDIYSHYQQVTSRFRAPEKLSTSATLSRADRALIMANKVTNQHPSLNSLVQQIKGYQQEISSSIKDQQEINKEICTLVTTRIHDIYDQSNIKVGLIVLIGLFLYPFFIVLFYLYGFVAYITVSILIQQKFFTYVEKHIIQIGLE